MFNKTYFILITYLAFCFITEGRANNYCSEESSWEDFPSDAALEWDGDPSCCQVCDGTPCRCILLPEAPPLFLPFIADPRQVTNSAAWRFGEKHFDRHVGAVSFGGPFPLVRCYDPWGYPGAVEFYIEGGIWAIFEHMSETSPLVNADYYVAFPLSYAIGPWSFRLRPYHISSHLGDEFLLLHPGFDRRNASSEYIDFFVSWQKNEHLRIYGGLGGIIRSDKEFRQRKFYAEYGAEVFFPWFRKYLCCSHLLIEPFFAMHFRTYADFDYKFDGTFALGYQLGKTIGIQRCLRAFLEYHNGFCSDGQFSHLAGTKYWALKLTYGF